MKAEPKESEAKQRPNEAQRDDETNAATEAVFSIGGRNRAAKLLLLPLFWNLDQWSCGHYWPGSSLPNGSRLSCGAKLKHSQTQFYHRRRAPSASGAC
jgi:hypothetical protein